jgi:uncharacterized membrane protein
MEDGGHDMAARQYTDSEARNRAIRWTAIGFGIAGAAVAIRQLAGSRRDDRQDASSAVSKAFTINRSPDEVAQLWNELDPLGDVVEHVRFDVAPGERGTEVRVQFQPAWFGRRSPARVQELLRQFKQLAETGEIARSTGSRTVREFGDMPEGGRLEELLVGGAK